MTAASVWRFLPALCFLIAVLVLSNANASGDRDPSLWIMPSVNNGGCKGTIGECTGTDFDLDSETNRRILQSTTRYISYGALARNNVPCSRRGASYYNCRAGAQANPYNRGCSAITLCRSS